MADYTSPKLGELNEIGFSKEDMVTYDGMTKAQMNRAAVRKAFDRTSLHNDKGTSLGVVLTSGICVEQGPTPWPNVEETSEGPKNRYHAIVRILEDGDACNVEPNLQKIVTGDFEVQDRISLSSHQRYYSAPIEAINGTAYNPGDIVQVTKDGLLLDIVKKGPYGLRERAKQARQTATDAFENSAVVSFLENIFPERNPMEENSNVPGEGIEDVYYKDNPLLAALGVPYVWGAGAITEKRGRAAWVPWDNWPNGVASSLAEQNGFPDARGYDCSGFAQSALLALNIVPIGWHWPDLNGNPNVHYDVAVSHMWSCARSNLVSNITVISDLTTVQRGDLAIFGKSSSSVSHVAVVCGPMKPDGLIECIDAGGRGSGSRCYGQIPSAKVRVLQDATWGANGPKALGIIRVRP
tara:strand:- start:263 stop:1489 length:1227 start_codon:yes stop_codon:yes gene_type:complete